MPAHRFKWTPEWIAMVYQLREEKLCVQDVCNALGIAAETLYRARREGVITLTPLRRTNKRFVELNRTEESIAAAKNDYTKAIPVVKTKWTNDLITRAINLRVISKMTTDEVAKGIGVSRCTLLRARKQGVLSLPPLSYRSGKMVENKMGRSPGT